jgi:hypothetical protein
MSFNFFKAKPDHVAIADKIRAKVAKTLIKRHNMDWIATSAGMMGSVYMIGFSFQINHPMDRNEARCRLVDCVEELIQAVNENVEIRPFLKNYPFTTKNVKIAIFISQPDGTNVYDPDFSVVSICESNEIIFYTNEPNKIPYKNEYHEPYQEALSLVKSS